MKFIEIILVIICSSEYLHDCMMQLIRVFI